MNDRPAQPPFVPDLLRSAEAALQAGRHDEARALFGQLAAAAPADPRPALGLVRALIARGEPAAAIERISASQHLVQRAPVEWDAQLGHALYRLGRHGEAESAFLRVLRVAPEHRMARLQMFRLLRHNERYEEAMALLEPAPSEAMTDFAAYLVVSKLDLLLDLWRIEEARILHNAAVERAATTSALNQLFASAAPTHGDDAPQAHTRMLKRLSEVPDGISAERRLLTARLRLALGDRSEFIAVAQSLLDAGEGGVLRPHLRAARDTLSGTAEASLRRERVFVIGLSRTGTSSLHQALTELGYCSAHWANPITNGILSIEDMALFDAVSDAPVADAVEELADRYPSARFILSERPVDLWQRSIEAHYRRRHGAPDVATLRRLLETHAQMPGGIRWRRVHEGLYTQHTDFAAAHAAHQARVARCFADAPARLLRFDVTAGDGWEKLCGFLQRPRPNTAFPHLNAG
ncbi:tetratricopeptide repeat protein [Roseomonas sp. HJA6]|uniref:Tetratricopeptide repeat protein n=1 Tax=Roseomonas alba TaxID=2846776 RepID=A0ABS7AI46_9PROT|nr:sulfotransferase [Neoroseomonas alba]MBW6401998.1 tetratricopeptide repeat protein [Neoroseomonas alba]